MKELISAKLIEQDDGDIVAEIDPDETNGEGLQLLIQRLGRVRQLLAPEVTAQPVQGVDGAEVVLNPPWGIADTFQNGVCLFLRHPMYGWLSFQMPPGFPEELTRKTAMAHSPPEGPAH